MTGSWTSIAGAGNSPGARGSTRPTCRSSARRRGLEERHGRSLERQPARDALAGDGCGVCDVRRRKRRPADRGATAGGNHRRGVVSGAQASAHRALRAVCVFYRAGHVLRRHRESDAGDAGVQGIGSAVVDVMPNDDFELIAPPDFRIDQECSPPRSSPGSRSRLWSERITGFSFHCGRAHGGNPARPSDSGEPRRRPAPRRQPQAGQGGRSPRSGTFSPR